MSILHILNGDAPRASLEQSGIPGSFVAWPDVLHEGPTPLLAGGGWIEGRSRYLADAGYGSLDAIRGDYRERDAALESWSRHEAADVQPRPGRLPDGTLALRRAGAVVLAGNADQVALNGIDRWLGGTHLTADHYWRWNGATLVADR